MSRGSLWKLLPIACLLAACTAGLGSTPSGVGRPHRTPSPAAKPHPTPTPTRTPTAAPTPTPVPSPSSDGLASPSPQASPTDTPPPSPSPSPAAGVSFSKDVAPLVMRCERCHDTAFSTYDGAKGSIDTIISVTSSGAMPRGGPRFTDAEVATLQAWKDAGMPDN